MKLGIIKFLFALGLLAPMLIYAQPTASPGAGFEWVMTGSSSYIDNGATASGAVFGDSGDTEPVDCSTYCGGNCDGDGLLEKLVFGGTSLPASSCEQRAVNLVHWINANPDSGVTNGATSGTVHLATAAQIAIIDAGTKISGTQNKGFIIGGNGPGNFSFFDTQVNYSMNWHIDEYTLTGGTGPQVIEREWNWGEPGGGTQIEMSGWNDYSTDPFETIGSQVLSVPLGSIVETGGNLEIVFEGSMEMLLSRTNGQADGKVQTVPILEGEATYTVNYDVWEIQTTLPVELTTFDGVYDNGEVNLSWTTASEINSDKFLIERASTDVKDWNAIGEVKSKGNSNRNNSYSFVDAESGDGQNYYRLRQIDRDGAESLSDIIQVTRPMKETLYTIYPNPVRDQLKLSYTTDASGTLTIIDQNGIVVHRNIVQPEIDIRDLAPGLYTVRIQNEDGALKWSQRFIKQ